VFKDDDDELAAQLTLSRGELVALHALRLQMMKTDIAKERRRAIAERKQETLTRFHDEFSRSLRPLETPSRTPTCVTQTSHRNSLAPSASDPER
jgi:hypothetical protein